MLLPKKPTLYAFLNKLRQGFHRVQYHLYGFISPVIKVEAGINLSIDHSLFYFSFSMLLQSLFSLFFIRGKSWDILPLLEISCTYHLVVEFGLSLAFVDVSPSSTVQCFISLRKNIVLR